MKKILLILLVILAILALVGCGKQTPTPIDPTPVEPVQPIQDKYTVTFYDMNNNVLQKVQLEKGEIPNYTDYNGIVQVIHEDNELYSFIGWDKEIKPVTEDTSYYAQYKKYYLDEASAAPVKESGLKIINNSATDPYVFSLNKYGSPTGGPFEYSLDDGYTWNDCTIGDPITIEANEFALFRSKSDTVKCASSNSTDYYYFSFDTTNTDKFTVDGDLTYLLSKKGNVKTLPNTHWYALAGLFKGAKNLVLGNNLTINLDTLSTGCCYELFASSDITSIPAGLLPATNLASYCYSNMFNTCENLSSIPNDLLPASTLADNCYSNMFSNCSSINTSLPDLNASTLAVNCYNNMFKNCTSMTIAPDLPATDLTGADGCYQHMFNGCSDLLSAKISAITISDLCMNYMFYNCSSLNDIELGLNAYTTDYTTTTTSRTATTTNLFNTSHASTGTVQCPDGPATASAFSTELIKLFYNGDPWTGWTVSK